MKTGFNKGTFTWQYLAILDFNLEESFLQQYLCLEIPRNFME